MGADQHAHARTAVRLGAGLVLDHRDLIPEAVRDAVTAILQDASYRSTADELARDLASMPGPERAVAALERLVSGRAGTTDRRR